MLYSSLLGKTKKNVSKEEQSKSAQLLLKSGYVQREMAGAYAYLPLGLIVLQKLIRIIREEMNAIGGQELLLSSLQKPELFETTNRWSDEEVDIWFKTKTKSGSELGLAFSHEEPLVSILTKEIQSYKDLPLYPYQFQNKFRNELRAKSGLLRTREFIMKDMYSFSRNVKEFEDYYEKAKDAYMKIFGRVGIGNETYITFASGGIFSKYSHEFQSLSEVGEDTIYIDKEKRIAINKEVYTDEVIKELGVDKNNLVEKKAIEVGNIFPLKTKFSNAGNLYYTDETGQKQEIIMGCYGIGLGRLMGTIVELNYDYKGIIWPENVAPYEVHLIGLTLDNTRIMEKATVIYKLLTGAGVEVLFDDRLDVSAGEKFSDADLIGIPHRVVISQKTGDQVEIKKRSEEKAELVSKEGLLNRLANP